MDSHTNDREHYSADRLPRGWMVYNRFGHGIASVYLNDRAVRLYFAALPHLPASVVVTALRACHNADKAGWRDDEVALACYPHPTAPRRSRSLMPCAKPFT